jgi:hypothetical protein
MTIVHGMLFDALLLLAFAGAAIGLYALLAPSHSWTSPEASAGSMRGIWPRWRCLHGLR